MDKEILAEHLKRYIDDPMWSGHSEVPKALLRLCHEQLLDQVNSEPVGVVRHKSHPMSDNPDAYIDWQFGGDVINLPDGMRLYTTPQPAQVPDKKSIKGTGDIIDDVWNSGWNACIEEILNKEV